MTTCHPDQRHALLLRLSLPRRPWPSWDRLCEAVRLPVYASQGG